MRPSALVLLLAPLLATCGTERDRPRLLVVGWDGASFREVDRLVAAGELPNVARLMRRGVQARLESTIIPISSAAWPSATTGKGPGDTGVYTFFAEKPGSYDVELISSRSNRAAPLWRILSAHGRRSIVFGVPVTYPPEPILGTMVAGMLSPFRAAYTWPPEYADALRARGFEPDLDVWLEARPVGWDDIERQLAIKEEVLLELLGKDDWDLAFIVFKSLDVVSHLAYGEDFSAYIAPLYRRLDGILGALLEEVGADTNVVLLSDHGFQTYAAGLNLHAWLVEQGFSARKEKVKRFTIDENDTLAVRERQIVLQLRNELDWSRTRAFAAQSEGNYGAIRLNLAGREAEGSLAPEDVERVLVELTAALEALTDEGGKQLVTRVFRGADLHPGPYVGIVPDLLFETDEDWQVFSDPEEERVLGPYAAVVPDHDLYGILVAAGPSFAHVAERGEARIADVAPTALHLLGQPVYAEMTGVVRTELLDLDAPVVVLREADDPLLRAAPNAAAAPFTPEELREIEERLRTLGYVD